MDSLLIEYLSKQPQLRWEEATVTSLDADGTITINFNGGTVPSVMVLKPYVPVVGDLVQCLFFAPRGVLAMGSTKVQAVVEPPVSAYTTVAPTGYATWTIADLDADPPIPDGFWTPNELVQVKGRKACWFYNKAAFAPLAGKVINSVEIEVWTDTGGSPVFVVHGNASATGEYVQLTNETAYQYVEPAVLTWVPIAIGVGELLADQAGLARGIALSANVYSVPETVFTGRGTLRFTTLS